MKKIVIGVLLLTILACNAKTPKIKLSSAASLTDVLTALSQEYGKEKNAEFQLNFASSSICAKQIGKGMQADIFVSANPKWSQYLIDKKIVAKENSKTLLHNSLVVVIPAGSELVIKSLADLDKCQKIACGDLSHVPAGIYAKKSLERAGVFTQLEQKIIGAVDVRAAMSMVESGSIDCGIVYKTDALVGKNIEIAFEVPAEFTPQITYTISCLTPQGEKFCQFLQSDKAKTFYKKFGFTPAF